MFFFYCYRRLDPSNDRLQRTSRFSKGHITVVKMVIAACAKACCCVIVSEKLHIQFYMDTQQRNILNISGMQILKLSFIAKNLFQCVDIRWTHNQKVSICNNTQSSEHKDSDEQSWQNVITILMCSSLDLIKVFVTK